MAVKTYKFDDNTQLSPHFNVQEFRCKCSQHQDILIAEELVDKLERLYAKLDCYHRAQKITEKLYESGLITFDEYDRITQKNRKIFSPLFADFLPKTLEKSAKQI